MEEKVIQLPYNWTPRPDQLELWMYLQNGGLRASEIAHRRWGKDEIGLRWSSVAMHRRVGNYWHMLPEYSQGRKAIWEAINPRTGKKRIDEAFPDEIRASTRNTDMVIQTKNGSQWQIVGSDNYNSFVGSPPIGVVISEWALADPLAWAYIRPILKENGGWVLFITSSRGNNHAIKTHHLFKANSKYFAQKIRADESGVFTKEDLEIEKQELIDLYGLELGLTIFNQEYMCSEEGAVLGAYYARQISDARSEGRITRVPHRRDLEVFTSWDIGVDDSTSIWFIQPVGKEFNVIDFYENTGYGSEHYAKIVKEKPYVYAGHYLPHDASQREFNTGEIAKNTEEILEDLGIRPIMVVERSKNMEIIVKKHIPAVRNLIPLCNFDERNCARGIAALEGYQSTFNDKTKVLGTRPLHNWCSHGADSFRTFAVGHEFIPELPAGRRESKVLQAILHREGSVTGNNNWGGL